MLAWAEEDAEYEQQRRELWINLEEVHANSSAARDWFAEGAIEGNPLILFSGPEKSHKSWSAMQLAVATVLGAPWLERFPVRRPGTVVYLDGEYGPHEFTRRICRIARAFGADERRVLNSIRYRYSIDVTLRSSDLVLNRITRDVNQYRPALVVLDPVRNHLDGDENEAHVVLAAFAALARLKTIGRCPVLLIHHLNKSGKFSGSRAFTTRADLIIEADDRGSPVYSARGRTLRPGVDPLAEPFSIEIEHTDDADDEIAATRLVYSGRSAAPPKAAPKTPGLGERILELLATASGALTLNSIADGLGRNGSDVKRELETLQAAGSVSLQPVMINGRQFSGWVTASGD